MDLQDIVKIDVSSYLMEKIFVIGYNKTGTYSFHHMFTKYGLKSQHGLNWELEKYQCFMDGTHDKGKYRIYYEIYPNSLFILNTRPLYNWLKSRSKHCYIYNKSWGWPPNTDQYVSWIRDRDEHFSSVIDFFSDKKEKLIICNIEKKNWQKFVLEHINIHSDYVNIHKHKISESRIDNKSLKLIENELEKAFFITKYNKESLIPENKDVSNYGCYL